MTSRGNSALACVALATATACGGEPGDPAPDEAILVVIVNPRVNVQNERPVATPGAVRGGVVVSVGPDRSATTTERGYAVLTGSPPGAHIVRLANGDVAGEIAVELEAGDHVDLAVALDVDGAAAMAEQRYRLGGPIVEISPMTPPADLAAALSGSGTTVLARQGVYGGDLVVSGSRTTVYCEGPAAPAFGGNCEVTGSLTVTGSGVRVRGTLVRQGISIEGSDGGLSFSFSNAPVEVSGSDADLLANVLCASVSVSGSGARVLGNYLGCGG